MGIFRVHVQQEYRILRLAEYFEGRRSLKAGTEDSVLMEPQ
jgi:hypothetical protein